MLELISAIDNMNHIVNLITENIVFVPVIFVAVYTAFVQIVARI